MIERGKYQSLTMINWNGFFARTFDIDELVTTLSGGNGAGKSTTMAAFITALIPDQSLLHFRNTTEAGSSQASRDKGLFGKLQPGVCYAALDVVNSKKQRLLFGVRLQQIAGRDKKVDIKPFLIQGLASHIKPTDVLMEALANNNARVKTINEVKQSIADQSTHKYEGAVVRVFNSVADYHTQMFDFGVLPKKLRNTSDRSKYYRLIEASLYGGISSAITRSLRDYLLPQNGGVKKAFQDMESALRENRITLEAIKSTQADRDLFKHLITESTNYVSSDYMRHTNDRKQRLDLALSLRHELNSTRHQLVQQQDLYRSTKETLEQLNEQEFDVEQDYQSASDHLQLIHGAMKQQEKIARYLDDLEALSERLEEQIIVVEDSQNTVIELEKKTTSAEQEVDSLQMQLADYQQALDVQQTRSLQYQQAVTVLEKARDVLQNQNLQAADVPQLLSDFKQQEEQQTQQLLSLKHKLDMFSAAVAQFDTGLALVKSVSDDVDRNNAYFKAKQAIEQLEASESLIANQNQLNAQLQESRSNLAKQKQVTDLCQQYNRDYGSLVINSNDIAEQYDQNQLRVDSLEEQIEINRDERLKTIQQAKHYKETLLQLESRAPVWLEANSALEILREKTDQPLSSRQSVMAEMQAILQQEKSKLSEKESLLARREALDKEIDQLASFGGANDTRLKGIADTLGGVLLSEIYDDITLEDAPYFSAMYGPSRSAVVVSDLTDIKDKLELLTDCPEDVYIIEGDVDAFDDSTFNVDELDGAVCVQYSERQIRYSRLPVNPLFGRAAREQRLEQLRSHRDEVIESHAKAAFDSQKLQRLYQSFSHFVSHFMESAFQTDPERELQQVKQNYAQCQTNLEQIESSLAQLKAQLNSCKQALNLLDKIASMIGYLNDESYVEKHRDLELKLSEIANAKRYVEQHKQSINKLTDYLSALQNDPAEHQSVEKDYQQIDQNLQTLKRQQYALEDLKERTGYFAYKDSASMLDQSSELSEQLKQKLVQAESQRGVNRLALKQAQREFNQYNQVLASLKSTYQAKTETIQEFQDELTEYGVNGDEATLQRAEERKAHLLEQVHSIRNNKAEQQRIITSTELEIKTLSKSIKRVSKQYKETRYVAVLAKSNWCEVIRLAKQHDVERRLYRRELAYLTGDELRSMSDKSLGALRLAVADNADLRDALRLSEENAYPERKVLFYIAVYQYLKQRIRQDIIRTDDPVEAIEEMEVELARLSEELSLRENRLAISSDSVASIINKTIQREQNRIRMLNQGLSNINFGQVKGVRLNVKIRQSHEVLLDGLANKQQQHRDLFESSKHTFSEAMAKLFQRVNPHIDMGQRSPQILGEELLDYRNYLELSVEVNRGSDGWLQAESGALSTGEAIGTGQSILLMVVQSWEEESRRLRSKDIVPCRLLFLDEAARLDSKSINTLFELCHRLDMQLLIAAPENISPEQGTTYKLVRKVIDNREHVHVVGLKGFDRKVAEMAESVELVN
ncbi:chromosome partition protein MukB [Vibrio sp. TH_r3]|uniref:chromosome partition protein MukB n=1 Tax=Vibrio sp. TH_r3 TaxID=3082084 RepID=UPI002955D03A|nr:chromosome partition protein MukB [Vibrio sp. TH_r3]MDV7102984.1 chromosome partition protein MukB [Vibrio sp. TH_r3]